MKQTFKPGTICDRCGMDRAEAKRLQFECHVYDRHYGKHQWNKEAVTLTVEHLKA